MFGKFVGKQYDTWIGFEKGDKSFFVKIITSVKYIKKDVH